MFYYRPTSRLPSLISRPTLTNLTPDTTSTLATLHSVRVGTVTVLDSEGFSHSDISTVTGHKTIESVSRYVRNTSDAKRQKMSDALRAAMQSGSEININGNLASTSTIQISDVPKVNFNGTFNDCTFIMKQ